MSQKPTSITDPTQQVELNGLSSNKGYSTVQQQHVVFSHVWNGRGLMLKGPTWKCLVTDQLNFFD